MKIKTRMSNFEVMRIISMFYIVLFHTMTNFKELLTDSSPKLSLILNFLIALTVVHVNSFILLSGFFQYKKQPNKSKIISLLKVSWFYRVVSTVILLYFGLTDLTHLEILHEFFPLPMGHEHWFIHYYVILYLISPYLNDYINSIDKNKLKKTIITFLVLDSALPFITNNLFFSASNGFSLIHFVTLYFIGAFFGKYDIRKSYWFNRFSDKFYRNIHIISYLLLTFMIVVINYFGDYLNTISGSGTILNEVGNIFNLSYTYCFILTIIQSCAYFLFFSTLDIGQKPVINKVAGLIFGVYLIHELEIPKKLYYDYFKFDLYNMPSLYVLFRVFYLSVLVFLGCSLIELIRQSIVMFISKIKSLKKSKVK